MREFLHVNDIGDLNVALKEAQEIKQDRYKFEHLGHHHTVLLIFSTTVCARVCQRRKQHATSVWTLLCST